MERIQGRFDELDARAEAIKETMKTVQKKVRSALQNLNTPTQYKTKNVDVLDREMLLQWSTSVQSLIARVFGTDDPTYEEFERMKNVGGSVHTKFKSLNAVFQSAKDQFEGGHLFRIRCLVHAELFDDELEQAEHFLHLGHKVPAAVIAGTVLETFLRELCSQNPSIEPARSLNRMNDDLAKEDAYSLAKKRQIQGWADIRNAAAHGEPVKFDDNDVSRMIEGIRDFISKRMSQ